MTRAEIASHSIKREECSRRKAAPFQHTKADTPSSGIACTHEGTDQQWTSNTGMIVFDAADIDAESAFWAGLLDGSVDAWSDRWRAVWIDSDWQIGVQLAPDHVPPEWPDGTPQQIHLDFSFEGMPAFDEAHQKVLGLGGRLLKAASRDDPRGVQVYADPAGHPFCLGWLPRRA